MQGGVAHERIPCGAFAVIRNANREPFFVSSVPFVVRSALNNLPTSVALEQVGETGEGVMGRTRAGGLVLARRGVDIALVFVIVAVDAQ